MSNISMGSFDQQDIMDIHIHFLFEKKLTLSDTSNTQCKLIIPKKDVKDRFVTFWTHEQIKEGIPLRVYDMDDGRQMNEKSYYRRSNSRARSCSSRRQITEKSSYRRSNSRARSCSSRRRHQIQQPLARNT